MKKIINIVIIIGTILFLTFIAFATGDGNIDSGGSGGSGSGTSQNKWSAGDDGVRVSIVNTENQQVVSTPIDFSNKDRSDIKYHFGKVSKIQYRNGKKLSPQTVYKSIIPTEKMPTIVSTKGNNISDIKRYFTTAETVALISEKLNIEYEDIISGKYKLLLEPMVYVTYGGSKWAMTSHEAALYNEKTNNDIVMKFNSISHRSLPFSMFLEVSDLGFPAYKGATNKATKDHVIKEQLGLGIVRFNGTLPEDPTKPTPTPEEKPEDKPNIDIDTKNYDYRVNTDVISSIEIKATNKVTPKNPISVTFNVLGKNHTVDNIVIPEGSSQLVWVKWHTPSTPQTVNIDVSIKNANVNSAKIKAVVGELKEITPPNPTADDRNDKFKMPNLPNNNNATSSTWSKWSCKWKENMKWVVYGEDEGGNDIGEWIDFGDWEYSITKYSADLTANMDLVPGLRTPPTWFEKDGEYTMKSGYGVNTKVNTNVTYNSSQNDVTSAQNIITTFSDFEYEKYNRILEKTSNNDFKSQFEFKKNKYSTYSDRTHYTPIWYKDNTNYIVNAEIIDVWTPTGMLRVNLNDRIMIDGSLFDDRHIAIMK